MELMRAVGGTSLFQGLAPKQLERLANIATSRQVDKGQIIFTTGEEAKGFYSVATGKVRIFRAVPSGKEHVLHVFGPGEAFGEVAVFKDMRFPATAQALENSRLLFYPRLAFVNTLKDDPDLAMQMLALLSERLKFFVKKIEDLSLKELPSRLAGHFLVLAGSHHKDTFSLDMPKSQLAAYLGALPETLSRALRDMQDRELILVDGRTITLKDRETLELLARGEL
ncbi:Crp/Fnr family transcriptional regulator [Megalodesulfovibrio gigas]|uniref:Putative cAMP-binding protein n=1 Tax=Megalodesulfovibrio gigas (strain ATCC 19364 / DSM 1382 / NCIMB 9332 / VKM B-1759) TaxID=1121448 RepID=T2GAL9_MEGG1|nr:Crp/Fnr family transcriptional regulator [Megalodesulfovibrio gigas]AGW13338.1 putative cAMP-binding protein [Megalodesulfovibrio gigas DSM 1382 = ATCC 19364]